MLTLNQLLCQMDVIISDLRETNHNASFLREIETIDELVKAAQTTLHEGQTSHQNTLPYDKRSFSYLDYYSNNSKIVSAQLGFMYKNGKIFFNRFGIKYKLVVHEDCNNGIELSDLIEKILEKACRSKHQRINSRFSELLLKFNNDEYKKFYLDRVKESLPVLSDIDEDSTLTYECREKLFCILKNCNALLSKNPELIKEHTNLTDKTLLILAVHDLYNIFLHDFLPYEKYFLLFEEIILSLPTPKKSAAIKSISERKFEDAEQKDLVKLLDQQCADFTEYVNSAPEQQSEDDEEEIQPHHYHAEKPNTSQVSEPKVVDAGSLFKSLNLSR